MCLCGSVMRMSDWKGEGGKGLVRKGFFMMVDHL
jgi:hypothetical protein